MEQYGIIYKITCVETPHVYIGKTKKSLVERWHNHKRDLKRFQNYVHTPGTKKRGFCTYLYRAMSQYGFDKFKIERIASAASLEELNELESSLIIEHNTLAPNGYNLTTGGDGGWDHPPELKEKMRENTIKGIRDNIDKLRTNELSKGLPMHVIYTKLKGEHDAFMIQKHELCKQKEFKFKDYNNSVDDARKACLDFLTELERSKIPYKPPKTGNIDIKGIRQIVGGYQVKKMHLGIRYEKQFVDKNKTDADNFEDAKNHLEQLINSWK
jgi:hypothetical protein